MATATRQGTVTVKQPKVVFYYDRATFAAVVVILVLVLAVMTSVIVANLNQSKENELLLKKTDFGLTCIADLAAENARRIKHGQAYDSVLEAERFYAGCVERKFDASSQ